MIGIRLLLILSPVYVLAQSLVQPADVAATLAENTWHASRGMYSTKASGYPHDFSDNYRLLKTILAQYGDELKRGEAVYINYTTNNTHIQPQPKPVEHGLLIYHRNKKYYLESYRGYVKNGFFQAYYGDGQLYYQLKYTDGKPVGVYKQYDENGNLYVTQEIVDLDNGFLYYEYYHDNGQVASQGNVYKGVKINEWYYYTPQGSLEKIKYFDSRGNLVQLKEFQPEQ